MKSLAQKSVHQNQSFEPLPIHSSDSKSPLFDRQKLESKPAIQNTQRCTMTVEKL